MDFSRGLTNQWLLATDPGLAEVSKVNITLPIRIDTTYCLLNTIDNITLGQTFLWYSDNVNIEDESTVSHYSGFRFHNRDSDGRWILVISN